MRTQSSEFPKGTHFIWNKMWGRLSPRALLETMEILAIRNEEEVGSFVRVTRETVDQRRHNGASQVALVVKNPPAKAGGKRDLGSIPRLGRSRGEGNDNPLQYSCLANPMDRGAWRATVHGVPERWTGLK